MKKKADNSTILEFEIELKRHAIEGGYIYVPNHFRKNILKGLDGNVLLKGRTETFISKFKMDDNGRIYTILSDKKINTIGDWYRTINASEGDILKIQIDTSREKPKMIVEHISKYHNKMARYERPASWTGFRNIVDLMQLSKEIGLGSMAKLVSIGTTLDEIFSKSIQRSFSPEQMNDASIDECVRSIKNDPKLLMFFDEYWNSKEMRALFSHRPVQLILPKDTETDNEGQIGNFVLVDIDDAENLDPNSLDLIKQSQLSQLTSKYHLLLEHYSVLKESVENLLSMLPESTDDEQVSDRARKKALNKILGYVKETIENKEIQEELGNIIVEIIQDPIPLVQSFIGVGLPHLVDEGKRSMDHIINVTGMTVNGYSRTIDQLSNYQLLTNVIRIYWCPHHHKDPFYMIAFAPISRFKAKCPRCDQDLKSMGSSMIDSRLFRFMRHKDGLMTIAIAWYLQKKNYRWVANKYYDENEIDLVAYTDKKTYFIETKTLQYDNDLTAYRRKILDSLKKFEVKKKVIGDNKEGPEGEWLLVVNLPSESLSKHFVRSNEGVKIISIDDFPKTLEQ